MTFRVTALLGKKSTCSLDGAEPLLYAPLRKLQGRDAAENPESCILAVVTSLTEIEAGVSSAAHTEQDGEHDGLFLEGICNKVEAD